MLTTIQGKYRNGKIELNEDPHIEGEADVVVTFMNTPSTVEKSAVGKMITFGMLHVPGKRQSELEDFKIAEFDERTLDRE